MKKTNRIKTKILAAALSATMIFSFGAMTATTASAASVSSAMQNYQLPSAATDGFFSGAQSPPSVSILNFPRCAMRITTTPLS